MHVSAIGPGKFNLLGLEKFMPKQLPFIFVLAAGDNNQMLPWEVSPDPLRLSLVKSSVISVSKYVLLS